MKLLIPVSCVVLGAGARLGLTDPSLPPAASPAGPPRAASGEPPEPPAPPAPARPRALSSEGAERVFFDALNRDPTRRAEAIAALTSAYLEDPGDGATTLWLALAHLWAAAEGTRSEGLTHGVLAEHFLRRAGAICPGDHRINGWLLVNRALLAGQDPATAAEADAMLAEAVKRHPVFLAVPLAIARWDAPRDSSRFAEALAAMRATAAAGLATPTASNRPRWPNNVQGFLLGLADMELKGGSRQRAVAMLTAATQQPGYATWPHREQVERRLAEAQARADRYADADPSNDPPFALGPSSGIGCVVCHQGKE